MANAFFKNIAAGVESICSFACDALDTIMDPIGREETDELESIPKPTVRISQDVLNNFRKNVGRYTSETGGLLGSTEVEM